SPFPVVAETSAANNTIESAQPVAADVTVLGMAGADPDVFKVPAVAGMRLSIEVDCVRLADVHYGAAEFDLAVRVLDQTGRELATSDDTALHVQDPLVSLEIPAGLPGGHVYVEVAQAVLSPGDAPYCVHIGTFRRPLAAFPPGGPAGRPLVVEFLGDPLGPFSETVAVPATPGTFSWYGGAPSPLELRSSPYPNLLEDRAAAETRVPELPIAINGIIERVGDADAFRLTAKKGERHRVRVYASALGHAIDPVIRIRPLGADGRPGAVEVEADDSAGPARELFGTSIRAGGGFSDVFDPTVIWEVKADGESVLEIRDASGGGGPTAVYRIEIDSPPQSVTFVAESQFTADWPEMQRHTGLAIPQGNRWTVTLDLRKGQGTTFAGPFDIVARGLPAGVRLVSPRVPAQPPVNRYGNARWPVEFVAAADARPGTAVITLEARAVDPAVALESHCQQAVPFVNQSGGSAGRILRVDSFSLAVTDPAPIAVELVQPTIPVVRGGELSIPLQLTRRAVFDDPVEDQADFGPGGVGLPPKELIPSGASDAVLKISADGNAPLGKGPLYVMVTTLAVNGQIPRKPLIRVASPFIEVEVAEPFVQLASAPASVRRGGRATFAFEVTPKTPFEGEAEAKLLHLPKGVAVVGGITKVTKDSKQIAFEVEATDEALLGPVSGLECELLVRSAGQEIRQRAGKGTLRIDPRL
ncbi:MAG: serine protease, partial [Planctomycetaceae bacterium]